MASMGTGMEEESSTATAPAPQNPSLIIAGSTSRFHLFQSCRKNCFNHGPLPAVNPSIQKDHCTCALKSGVLVGAGEQAGPVLNPLLESAARPPGFSRFEWEERIVERTRSERRRRAPALPCDECF